MSLTSLKHYRTWAIILYDTLMITVSWLLAYAILNNFRTLHTEIYYIGLKALPILLFCQLLSYSYFRMHRPVWRLFSFVDVVRIIKVVGAGFLCFSFIWSFLHDLVGQIPRSIYILYPLMLAFTMALGRFMLRYHSERSQLEEGFKRVLVVGAGQGGELFIRDAKRTHVSQYSIIAIVDDDRYTWGKEIHGVRVYGGLKDIRKLVLRHGIDLIVIAMPSIKGERLKSVYQCCQAANVPIRTLPSLKDIVADHANISNLRDIKLEDLLGREPITLDWGRIRAFVDDRVILITGAGGSIGSELCRQIAQLKPQKIILTDNCEYNLYKINLEMSQIPGLNFTSHLMDVTDPVIVDYVMRNEHPEIIFHAAAYKHVPLLEQQVRQAIYNNVIGTQVLAMAAAALPHASRFVMVSTDKAVNPSNIMGASKRAAEIFCQSYNTQVNLLFITVRFGNVLGSAGSVVPRFKQQLAQGGPLTVTHPDMQRYFMTIPEACELILQSGSMGEGGEIFVLDMGKEVKILDLAKQLIQLSGKTPDEDIEIVFTGPRPGEKLREELFYQDEPLSKTHQQRVFISESQALRPFTDVMNLCQALRLACQQCDETLLKKLLHELVPEYSGAVHSEADVLAEETQGLPTSVTNGVAELA